MDLPRSSMYPHVSNYPQVVYAPVSSVPADTAYGGYYDLETGQQRFGKEGKEAVNSVNPVNTPSRVIDERDDGRRIFGFRPATFWLSLALVLVIILAAVGGGVGGILAGNSNADSGAVGTHTVTQTVASMTVTASVPPPTASSSTPTYGIARSYCKNETVYTTPSGAQFKEYCGIDWAEGWTGVNGQNVVDIEVLRLGSYEACMNQCVQYNQQRGSASCGAIAFIADITYAIAVLGDGGNCWLKNQAGVQDTLGDFAMPELYSVATLQG